MSWMNELNEWVEWMSQMSQMNESNESNESNEWVELHPKSNKINSAWNQHPPRFHTQAYLQQILFPQLLSTLHIE